jgi:hypothetical protein
MSKKDQGGDNVASHAVFRTLQWMRRHKFRPVPLHFQSKAAINRDYVNIDYQPPGDELWKSHNFGVGCALGPVCVGPIDIDLDCAEARHFASHFLPPTPAVFGRKSALRSHWVYRVDSATFASKAFEDPALKGQKGKGKPTLIEMRGDGGYQTVFPGSVHETTGETVEWAADPNSKVDLTLDVPVVVAADLIRAVRKVALASVLVRYVWTAGNHNESTKLLSGIFCQLGWSLEEAEAFIQALMDFDGDRDRSRMPTVRNTYRKHADGKPVAGQGILRKQLKNDKLVDAIMEWAGSTFVHVIGKINEQWAAGNVGGKFRVALTDVRPGQSPVFFAKDDWLSIMEPETVDITDDKGKVKTVKAGKLWIASKQRRMYSGIDFLPGEEDAGSVINLWTGWPTQPEAGDCSAWLELLRDVVCGGDPETNRWMLHWFASILRTPRTKARTAVVIVGPEGAGKSLLLSYFGQILGVGDYYVMVTKEDHITGKFNSHLGRTLLLHSEEALWAGDKKHAGIIKSLITDDMQMYEPKGLNPQPIRNFIRLIMTSNEQRAAAARAGDRRYTILDMGDRKISDELLKRVLHELHHDGPAALFQHLLDMDYDSTLASINIKNAALAEMKTHNFDTIDDWWFDTLMDGAILPDALRWASKWDHELEKEWPKVVSSRALHVALTIHCINQRNRGPVPSETALAIRLHKLTKVHLQRKQVSGYIRPMHEKGDPPTHLLIVQLSDRQSTIVNMPTLDECRKAFERYLGQSINWTEASDIVVEPRY